MNPYQFALQIRHKLRAVVWPTGATDVVFGSQKASSVHVFAGRPTEEQVPAGYPWCLVGIDAGTPDEDHPEFIEQGFTILSAVEVAGDPLGEFALIGGSVANLGKSVGRGILEVATLVRQAVENLTGIDGAKIMLSSTSTGAPATLGNNLHLALDELGLIALCTSALHYAEPQVLARSGTSWTWEGSHISDRFDFRRYTLGYKSGTTPAATISALDTTVYQDTTASTTHTVVTGQVYSVFAEYNSRAGTAGTSTDGESAGDYVGAFLVEA